MCGSNNLMWLTNLYILTTMHTASWYAVWLCSAPNRHRVISNAALSLSNGKSLVCTLNFISECSFLESQGINE